MTHEDLTWFAQGKENSERRVQLSDVKVPDQMWMVYSCTADNSSMFCVPIKYKHGIFIQMWIFALETVSGIPVYLFVTKLTGIWVEFQPITLSTADFF